MAKNEADAKAMALVTKDNTLPAHLQGTQKTAKVGNVDRSDLIIPRVKLLQAISPEVEGGYEGAKSGVFWHTTLSESLGNAVRVVPIILRKTYVLWAPRGDDRGILARASDGKNWDTPGLSFEFKPKGSPKVIKYNLGDQVGPDIGLGKFGSLIPEDPQSAPAAALTFEILFLFPDFKDVGAAVVINTRSSVRPARDLLSKIDAKPVNHYAQEYIMKAVDAKGADGPYKNYQYISNGYADEGDYKSAQELFEYYSKNNFRSNDEAGDAPDEGDAVSAKKTVADDGDTTGSNRF